MAKTAAKKRRKIMVINPGDKLYWLEKDRYGYQVLKILDGKTQEFKKWPTLINGVIDEFWGEKDKVDLYDAGHRFKDIEEFAGFASIIAFFMVCK